MSSVRQDHCQHKLASCHLWNGYCYLRTNWQDKYQLKSEIGKTFSGLPIDSNQLLGTLPEVFGNFIHLQFLFAFDNLFTKEIPCSIWNVDSLEWLLLKNNNMHASVPDSVCDNIDILELGDLSRFIDLPKVNCSCCESCHYIIYTIVLH